MNSSNTGSAGRSPDNHPHLLPASLIQSQYARVSPRIMAPTNVSGQAPQAADDRRRERVHDEQGERERAQGPRTGQRRHQDPGHRGEREADGPRQRRCPVGAAAVELQELTVVDHRSHGRARGGPVEEDAKAEGEHHGEHHGDDLVGGDRHVADRHGGGRAEEGGVASGLEVAPHPVDDADDEDEQDDRHEDLGDLRGALEQPDDVPLDEHAEHRGPAPGSPRSGRSAPATVHPSRRRPAAASRRTTTTWRPRRGPG